VLGPPPSIPDLHVLEEEKVTPIEGYIPFRTNAVYNHYSDGRHCAMDAGHSAVGEPLVRPANVKRARFERTGNPEADCSLADFTLVVQQEQQPFSFPGKKQLRWKSLVSLREGIYVCRLNLVDGGKIGKHYLVVDCWRRLVLDNAEKYPIPMDGLTDKQLMKRLECTGCEKIWQCMVLASHVDETKYV
jgi:hypothetical protein